MSHQTRAILHALTPQVHALKCALNAARSEHEEAFRLNPDSRGDLPPPELREGQEATPIGGENGGGEKDIYTTSAAASQAPSAAVGRNQQPIRHAHQQEIVVLVSTIGSQENHMGVPAERRAGSNAREEGSERAGPNTFPNNNSNNGGQPFPTSAEEGGITTVHGNLGSARREAELLASPRGKTPAAAAAAEANRRQVSVQILPEMRPHPGLLLLAEEHSPRTALAEIGKLGRDLAEMRVAADEATESRRRAEGRVVELEEIIAESERRHEVFRERGEARLETLKRAFAQEQDEGGTHVRRPTYVLFL